LQLKLHRFATAVNAGVAVVVQPVSNLLHEELLEAHAREDIDALALLYGRAATQSENEGDVDAACFFLTQAYIFALDGGLEIAVDYNRRLADYGRDKLQYDLARIKRTNS